MDFFSKIFSTAGDWVDDAWTWLGKDHNALKTLVIGGTALAGLSAANDKGGSSSGSARGLLDSKYSSPVSSGGAFRAAEAQRAKVYGTDAPIFKGTSYDSAKDWISMFSRIDSQ